MPFLFSRQSSRVSSNADEQENKRDVERGSISSGSGDKGKPSLLQISSIPQFVYDNPIIQGKNDHEVDGVPRIEITLAEEKDGTTDETDNAKPITLSVPKQLVADSAPSTPTDNEPMPRLEYYKDAMSLKKHMTRPTLDELHNPPPARKVSKSKRPSIFSLRSSNVDGDAEPVKFGWIRGVFIRCVLNIWGVMLFLRMGWMTGQAGIGYSIAIIVLSSLVTTLTTLSMSAICTNGEVKGGGAYYMISRSLGPEFGGAIGIIFALANCIAVSMYIVGAAEAVRDLLRVFDAGIVEYPSGTNDIRIAGVIFLILTAAITIVGMEWEAKAQIVLLILLLTAMVDYFVGACLPPTPDQMVKGFVGWDLNLVTENWFPDFRGETFFTVFAVFFPSVTGILAGANISGDLKDPSSAIPKGTLSAILTTSITYIVIVFWLGATSLRDATGKIEDLADGSFRNCTGKPCDHGLINYNQIMEMTSAFGPLIYAGIFAATLSSALAALVSAPRIFQALCKDKIFPALNVFAKGSGPAGNDPRRASILVFIIALFFTVIGELNAIAPIISNFFMSAYSLVNFSCFHASYVKSPGFRPGFRYYNKWLSLLGAILCIVVMFVMNWITALVTYGIIIALYIYLNKKKPPVNWGSSTQGYIYKSALSAVVKLNRVEDHVKNYRPAILVLTGNISSRAPLIDFTYHITRNQGLMVCGHVISSPLPKKVRSAILQHSYQCLEERKVKAFYNLIESDSFSDGVYALLQLTGLGKLRPNILLLGYKTSWRTCDEHDLQEYFAVIHHALDMHIALGILRLPEGLGYEAFFESDFGIPYGEGPDLPKASEEIFPNAPSEPTIPAINFTPSADDKSHLKLPATIAKFRRLTSIEVAKQQCGEIPDEVTNAVNQFQKKQRKGTIDVWWLYDDGGLTILIPYLLSGRPQWKACRLRVFIVAQKDNDLQQLEQNMTALFKKFRIDISDVTVLSDINVNPQEDSKKQFDNLISKWRNSDHTNISSNNTKSQLNISPSDWTANKAKTNRYIRLRELLVQHSKKATLVVMTLPMPRKGTCPAPLYMAWLETLSSEMPPFLFIRGNQTSVLTFYS